MKRAYQENGYNIFIVDNLDELVKYYNEKIFAPFNNLGEDGNLITKFLDENLIKKW